MTVYYTFLMFLLQIVATGTTRGKPRLHNSDGYMYTVRSKTANATYWWCHIRQKENKCPATVVERGGAFTEGVHGHNHPGRPSALLHTQVGERRYILIL